MSIRIPVQTKILDPRLGRDFPLPTYATESSAGLDLRAMVDQPLVLQPNQSVLVETGLSIFVQDPHWVAAIMPRSGLGSKGLVLGNLTGVIDADYQGPLKVCLWNRSDVEMTVAPGDKVAQLLLLPVGHMELVVVDEFDANTVRGAGGFGHTGT